MRASGAACPKRSCCHIKKRNSDTQLNSVQVLVNKLWISDSVSTFFPYKNIRFNISVSLCAVSAGNNWLTHNIGRWLSTRPWRMCTSCSCHGPRLQNLNEQYLEEVSYWRPGQNGYLPGLDNWGLEIFYRFSFRTSIISPLKCRFLNGSGMMLEV